MACTSVKSAFVLRHEAIYSVIIWGKIHEQDFKKSL